MTDLGLESRLLVDAARDGFGPDEMAVRRMRARIAAAVAGGAVGIAAGHAASAATPGTAATGTAATGATAIGGAVSSAIATKLVIAAIGIAIAAGIGVAVYAVTAHHAVPAATTTATREEIAPRVTSAPPAPIHRDASPVAAEPAPAAPAPVREAPANAIRSEPAHAAAPRVLPPPPAPQVLSLARETQLIGEAESALSGGRPADAIAAVARYDAETAGRGQLAEEAAAIDVEARCKSGDPKAREALDQFAVRWPRSRETARLAAACAR